MRPTTTTTPAMSNAPISLADLEARYFSLKNSVESKIAQCEQEVAAIGREIEETPRGFLRRVRDALFGSWATERRGYLTAHLGKLYAVRQDVSDLARALKEEFPDLDLDTEPSPTPARLRAP